MARLTNGERSLRGAIEKLESSDESLDWLLVWSGCEIQEARKRFDRRTEASFAEANRVLASHSLNVQRAIRLLEAERRGEYIETGDE